jgi:predicted DNA-binding mobile mystery protein A
MNKSTRSAVARRSLDERFKKLPALTRALTRPTRGWVAAIRNALGMSYRQMASRLGVDPSAIGHLERSEHSGSVQLATLRRAAEALNCTLVYAFVPNESLETIVQNRMRDVARKQLHTVDHTMRLEHQSVSAQDVETQIDLFAKQIPQRTLWDD